MTPIYAGTSPTPARIRIQARGSNGSGLDVTIENRPKRRPAVDPGLLPVPLPAPTQPDAP